VIWCVDTSAFYAYLIEGDRFHGLVSACIREAATRDEKLVSTSFVLSETQDLLQVRHGLKAAKVFMDRVYPAVEWRWVDEDMFGRMLKIHAGQKERGFTIVDASVVACIEERPGSACLAVDEGLSGFGFEVLPWVPEQ